VEEEEEEALGIGAVNSDATIKSRVRNAVAAPAK
jgi:hypothetical protein